MAAKKANLSRDQAASIYEDLRKNFAAYSGGKSPQQIKAALAAGSQRQNLGSISGVTPQGFDSQAARPQAVGVSPEEQMLAMMMARHAEKKQGKIGSKLAVSIVLICAATKFALGAIEYSGAFGVENAQATMTMAPQKASLPIDSNFSPEQVALLKALDTRRVELEQRRIALDKREEEFSNRDREFAIKLAELRELTASLKGNREADSKKKIAQLDQLSNVYGSMDPREAALLIEQLEDPIAIELLNRMPEKRIGQILALMNKDKALIITKLLSGKFLN